ncbi:MAG: hypothetical protein ACOC97_02640 [Myxococcota bacterium]
MSPKHPEHQVKGVWFVSGEAYLRATLPSGEYDRLLASLPAQARSALESPMPSEWYPESAAADLQRAWFEVAAGGSEAEFARMIAAASEHGLNRFFRALARVATGRFLIKQAPGIWKHLRRGPATVRVEDQGGSMVVRYARFPFFEDRLYATVFQVQLATLVRVATGTTPSTRILDMTATSLDTEIDLD